MATVTPNYAASSDLTITLASLATSSGLTAGRESTQVDNTTNKYMDAILEGYVTTNGTTNVTINTQVNIYVWGSNVSLATTSKDSLTGTDSNVTITTAGVLNGFLRLAAVLTVDAVTQSRTYDFGGVSVANTLGMQSIPAYWGVFVTHNTGQILHATAGNHAISFSGIKFDIA